MMRFLLVAILSLLSMVHAPRFPASASAWTENKIFNMAVSPNGKLLALAASFGIQVYRLSNGEVVYALRNETENYWQGTYASIAWSPDGTNLAIGNPNKGVRIWDVSSSQVD